MVVQYTISVVMQVYVMLWFFTIKLYLTCIQ